LPVLTSYVEGRDFFKNSLTRNASLIFSFLLCFYSTRREWARSTIGVGAGVPFGVGDQQHPNLSREAYSFPFADALGLS